MDNPELNLLLPNGSKPLPGFRLRRLEMLNWGTFNQRVHVLSPDGGWTLLVGENGSGKSTAVDALRTLLVPPRLLHYNDASGEQRRRDRTRRSYIRGAWASSSQEESSSAITQYLRSEGEQSILLAVFANQKTGLEVTLVQILWDLGEKIDEVFAVIRGDRNIREHLSNLGTTREIRKTLRTRGFEAFESFTGYSESFRRLLAIPGEGALEVFNQAIGVKEVTDVNQFVRRHMLEQSDAPEFIRDTLQPHFKTLDECRQAIEKAKKQLSQLEPIVGYHVKIEEALRKKRELEELHQILVGYYAKKHLALRLKEAEELDVQVKSLERQANDLGTAQKQDSEQKEAIQAALNSDSTGLSIKRLQMDLESARQRKSDKESLYRALQGSLKLLQKQVPIETEDQFANLRSRLISDRGLIARNREATHQKMLGYQIEQRDALKDRGQLKDDLDSLRQHRVLIPREFVTIREALCSGTGIPPLELPFAGELMEVKPEFRDWTGAIERLIQSFGISLVVPERHYIGVTRFINEHHLGLRFVYHRVSETLPPPPTNESSEMHRVFSRLNYRTDHPLHCWVAAEARRMYRHVCCADIQQLQRESFGLTREGLVRDGATRHIKDDRRQVTDASNWVLGWSTAEKINALERLIENAEKRAQQAGLKVKQTTEQVAKLESELGAIDAIIAVKLFASIDFQIEQPIIERLVRDIQALESSSDKRKKLNEQLKTITEAIEKRHHQIIRVAGDARLAEDQQKRNQEARSLLESTLAEQAPVIWEKYEDRLIQIQEQKLLTIFNVDAVEKQVNDHVQRAINSQGGIANTAERAMLPLMTTFLQEHNEYSTDLAAKVEFAAEFALLRVRLEKEELPKHEKRFKEFLSTNLIGDMAMFNSKLTEHEKDIRDRIDRVNESLRKIPFTASTYVQIVTTPTRAKEIGIFRAALRNCFAGALNPNDEDRTRIFENIRQLLARFDKEQDWTRQVTDARNWVEFGVKEFANADSKEMDYYSASSGKSGGQKAKLAFTILASAITAQYGLAGMGDESNSFRLVIIDEAFARTDEENSELALKLFQRLGLQLVVVGPFDAKARIVEDYVDSFHLSINPERNNSRLKRASRAEYEAQRDGAVSTTLNAQPT